MVRREIWEPNSYSRLCSIHFVAWKVLLSNTQSLLCLITMIMEACWRSTNVQHQLIDTPVINQMDPLLTWNVITHLRRWLPLMTWHLIKGMKLLFQQAHKTFLAYLILIAFTKRHNLKVYETKCRLRIHMSYTMYATSFNCVQNPLGWYKVNFLFAEAAGAIFRKSCILQICGGNTQDRNCIFYQQIDTRLKNQIMCLLWICIFTMKRYLWILQPRQWTLESSMWF